MKTQSKLKNDMSTYTGLEHECQLKPIEQKMYASL